MADRPTGVVLFFKRPCRPRAPLSKDFEKKYDACYSFAATVCQCYSKYSSSSSVRLTQKPLISVMRIYETEGLYRCFWIQVPVGIFVAH